jgi:hypothetical protein
MKTVHYADGYGGRLNYHTYCKKEIHIHSKEEDATIDPKEVKCKDCMDTPEWKQDLEENTNLNSSVKRRIFIESDVLHADELRSAQQAVSKMCKEKNLSSARRVFQDILDYAWFDLEKTWQSVKNSDEIYSQSSLMPLTGGYTGAPVIFNGMCERAIKENVTGKDVYILNSVENIYWDMIDMDVMVKAFEKNKLFMYNEDYEMVEVDVKTISKENK